jgi:hypothetical protein
MQRSTARLFLLAVSLASLSLHARAAKGGSAPELVAQERSAVVSISGLRQPRPTATTAVAGTSATGATVITTPGGIGSAARLPQQQTTRDGHRTG